MHANSNPIDTSRDIFLQSHPQTEAGRLYFEWKFDHYPGFPSSAYDSTFPVPRDILTWSDYDLDNCNGALSHNLISIRVSLSKLTAPPNSGTMKAKKDYRVLKIRLQDLIGT